MNRINILPSLQQHLKTECLYINEDRQVYNDQMEHLAVYTHLATKFDLANLHFDYVARAKCKSNVFVFEYNSYRFYMFPNSNDIHSCYK